MRYAFLFTGILLGAAFMYALDPESGHRRRSLARDQAVKLGHKAQRLAWRKGRHVRNRAYGLIAAVRKAA